MDDTEVIEYAKKAALLTLVFLKTKSGFVNIHKRDAVIPNSADYGLEQLNQFYLDEYKDKRSEQQKAYLEYAKRVTPQHMAEEYVKTLTDLTRSGVSGDHYLDPVSGQVKSISTLKKQLKSYKKELVKNVPTVLYKVKSLPPLYTKADWKNKYKETFTKPSKETKTSIPKSESIPSNTVVESDPTVKTNDDRKNEDADDVSSSSEEEEQDANWPSQEILEQIFSTASGTPEADEGQLIDFENDKNGDSSSARETTKPKETFPTVPSTSQAHGGGKQPLDSQTGNPLDNTNRKDKTQESESKKFKGSTDTTNELFESRSSFTQVNVPRKYKVKTPHLKKVFEEESKIFEHKLPSSALLRLKSFPYSYHFHKPYFMLHFRKYLRMLRRLLHISFIQKGMLKEMLFATLKFENDKLYYKINQPFFRDILENRHVFARIYKNMRTLKKKRPV